MCWHGEAKTRVLFLFHILRTVCFHAAWHERWRVMPQLKLLHSDINIVDRLSTDYVMMTTFRCSASRHVASSKNSASNLFDIFSSLVPVFLEYYFSGRLMDFPFERSWWVKDLIKSFGWICSLGSSLLFLVSYFLVRVRGGGIINYLRWPAASLSSSVFGLWLKSTSSCRTSLPLTTSACFLLVRFLICTCEKILWAWWAHTARSSNPVEEKRGEAASRPGPAAMTQHCVTFSTASPPALHDSHSAVFLHSPLFPLLFFWAKNRHV